MICFTFSSTAMRASPRMVQKLNKNHGAQKVRSAAYNTGQRQEKTTAARKKLRMAPSSKSTGPPEGV
jgi:hypothetical protein